MVLTSPPCLQARRQMASSGVPLRVLAPAALQLPRADRRAGGRGSGWHPAPPLSTSPGLREQPGFTLASRAAPLSLSQPSLNSCFTRSAFPIHWEKINKSNPQDLPLITSQLYLGLQLSFALLQSPSGRHASASNMPNSLSSEERPQ